MSVGVVRVLSVRSLGKGGTFPLRETDIDEDPVNQCHSLSKRPDRGRTYYSVKNFRDELNKYSFRGLPLMGNS